MNKYRIIFSPTGETEKVANTMTKFWNEVKDIDLSKTDLGFSSISLTKEDIAVIAMPSFGGVAPQLALDRLAKMNGNQCSAQLLLYTETEIMRIRLYRWKIMLLKQVFM